MHSPARARRPLEFLPVKPFHMNAETPEERRRPPLQPLSHQPTEPCPSGWWCLPGPRPRTRGTGGEGGERYLEHMLERYHLKTDITACKTIVTVLLDTWEKVFGSACTICIFIRSMIYAIGHAPPPSFLKGVRGWALTPVVLPVGGGPFNIPHTKQGGNKDRVLPFCAFLYPLFTYCCSHAFLEGENKKVIGYCTVFR